MKDRVEPVRRQRDREVHPKNTVAFRWKAFVIFDRIFIGDHKPEKKVVGEFVSVREFLKLNR